jgi:amidohydrolase
VLRAELDALPLVEATGVSWAATDGRMHACGHDLHLAALAAVARSARRVDLPAPVVVLLQPREEVSDSGARDVIAEGAIDDAMAVVGAHVQPRLAAGTVAATPGPVNAAVDEFAISVRGRGGHSGYPHTVNDSVLALSSVVVALQQIGARRIDPVVGVACMVNQVRAGSAYNVVPDLATASGSLRTMRVEDAETAHQAITDIVQNVAAAYGCVGEVGFHNSEPVLVNDPVLASRAAALLTTMGHPVTREFRSFGSDDFSHYCEHTRGLMLFVGTGAANGGLHEPTYLPDDRYVETTADALIAGYCAAVDPQPT